MAIFMTEPIQNLRALRNALAEKHSDAATRQRMQEIRNDTSMDEADRQAALDAMIKNGRGHLGGFLTNLDIYTNNLAGKKDIGDRNMEYNLGRWAYGFAGAMNGRVAANMVGLNPGSWLTNLVVVPQVWSRLGTGHVLSAMRDTIKNGLHDDGFIDRSTFLTNRYGTDTLAKGAIQKASEFAGKPFEWFDHYTANLAVRARYKSNLKNGMDAQSAMDDADAWAAALMGDRSLGGTPTMFNATNPLAKIFTTFQLEVNNTVSSTFKDMPQDAKEGGRSLALMAVKYLVGMYIFNELYELLVPGRRPAQDPLGILREFVEDLGKGGVGEAFGGLGTNLAQEVPFIGGLLDGGRVPISSALPNVRAVSGDFFGFLAGDTHGDRLKETLGKELSKPLWYLLPPFGGGQAKKIAEASMALADGGVYSHNRDGERQLRYPVNVTPEDVGRAMVFGVTTTKGGQAWIEGGFKTGSVAYTAAREGAKAAGVDMNTFDAWWNTQKGFVADKDAEGNSISGSLKAKEMDSIDALDITATQKLVLLQGITKEDAFTGVLDAQRKGLADETIWQWWSAKDRIAGDKNEAGETIQGSKKANTITAALEMGLDAEQTMVLLEATDYDFAEDMSPARQAGVDTGTLIYWWTAMALVKADRDVNGKAVTQGIGSRRQKLEQLLYSLPLNREQMAALLEAAGL